MLVTDTSTIEQVKYQQEFSAEILDYTQSVTDKLGASKELNRVTDTKNYK